MRILDNRVDQACRAIARQVEIVRALAAAPAVVAAEFDQIDWSADNSHLDSRTTTGEPAPSRTLLAMGIPREQALASLRVSFGMLNTLDEVNESVFGLQAGIFTRDIYKAHRAWEVLDVGGVVIGDVPSWRVDHMPYGGVKNSGLGREGIRFAIEDMTEIRLLAIRNPPEKPA